MSLLVVGVRSGGEIPCDGHLLSVRLGQRIILSLKSDIFQVRYTIIQSHGETHWYSGSYWSKNVHGPQTPRVTAIKSTFLNPPASRTSLNAFPSALTWNMATTFGTIPPYGSDNCNDRRTMLCRILGAA